MNDLEEVKKQALEEYTKERQRELIDLEKRNLRARENFWVRLFPWRIRFIRIDQPGSKIWQLRQELEKCGFSMQLVTDYPKERWAIERKNEC